MRIQIVKDKYNFRYINCPHCDSELRLSNSYIMINTKYEKGYYVTTFDCPCCKKQIKLNV